MSFKKMMGMKNQMVERKKIQQEEEDTNWVILSRYFVLFGIKNWTEEWKINFGRFYCSTLAVFKNLVLPNFCTVGYLQGGFR